MPLQRALEGIHQVPWAEHLSPPLAPNRLEEGGRTIHGPTEVNPPTTPRTLNQREHEGVQETEDIGSRRSNREATGS